jgi:hypothetical protein
LANVGYKSIEFVAVFLQQKRVFKNGILFKKRIEK